MRHQVGIGEEVLAGDLPLPPRAPVVEARETAGRTPRSSASSRVVAFEEGVAIGELRLPRDAAQLVRALQQSSAFESSASPLCSARVLDFERQIGSAGIGAMYARRLKTFNPSRPGLIVGVRGPLHVRRADRRVLAEAVLVVDAPQPAAAVALRELVPVQIERLDRVRARLESADRRELERLPRVGPVAAAAAAFGGAVVEQEAVPELVLRAADGEVDRVLADATATCPIASRRKVLGPNDDTSSPNAAGTEPYVRSPTALTLP